MRTVRATEVGDLVSLIRVSDESISSWRKGISSLVLERVPQVNK